MGILKPETELKCRRFAKQRWIIDQLINLERETLGGISPISTSPRRYTAGGIDLDMDFASVSKRVAKFDDICREFERVAQKREKFAQEAERRGHLVTARDNYVSAALLYADAGWPIFEDDHPLLTRYYQKKNECYDKVIEFAPHPIQRVEIPFQGTTLPGLLHLPNDDTASPWPCVVNIPGMDGFKEYLTTLYADKYLTRGMATLAIDGPGQGESCLRKTYVTGDNYTKVGKACYDFLKTQPTIDPQRVAIKGVSFGSLFALQAASAEPRYKALSIALTCLEPGCRTIFERGSPTFKLRFMWMAGYHDEEAFDEILAPKLTWEGYAQRLQCPTQIIAGGDDELSPLPYTVQCCDAIPAPTRLIVYEGAKHSIIGPSIPAHLEWRTLEADWIHDRLHDDPMVPERVLYSVSGHQRPTS